MKTKKLKKINCEYDGQIEISKLIPNTLNVQLYGDLNDDPDYLESLGDLIEDQGLHECVDVYEGTSELDSGHNRRLALILKKYTHVPFKYVKRPKDELSRLERIAAKNARKRLTSTQKYENVKLMINKRFDKKNPTKEENSKYIKLYSSMFSTSKKTYDMLDEIYLKRQDIYQKIEEGMGVKSGYNQLLEDEKWNNNLAASPSLIDMITRDHIKKTMYVVTDVMRKIYDTESTINGKKYKFVSGYQLNILQGMFHETFCKNLSQVLTDDIGEVCNAPNNMGAFDLEMPSRSWEPEVKSLRWSGGNMKGAKWSSNKLKQGYYFLLGSNADLTRFYVAYGWIEASAWNPRGKIKTLNLEKARNCNLKEFIGEIDASNDLHLEKIS